MELDLIPVRRALLSVTDKSGLVEFARGLHELGVELLSTGGTAATLRQAGLPVRDVAELTGVPEMLSGRVKTLHPRVHGALLADRERPEHQADLEAHGIAPIDLAVINLYAFEATVARPGVTLKEAVEDIDVGGPAMIRAAAKNHRHVGVVTDPARYPQVLAALRAHEGGLPRPLAFELAREAFHCTAAYDAAIATWLDQRAADDVPLRDETGPFPPRVHLVLNKARDLRYGENPHQAAALYRGGETPWGVGALTQLHGKELSFTNYLDVDAALRVLGEFEEPCAVIIKHANPCGVGFANVAARAYLRAFATDPLSAFGGIVGLNRVCDADTAAAIGDTFLEGILAPEFTGDALEMLSARRNIRLLALPECVRPSEESSGGPPPGHPATFDFRRLRGGFLAQEVDGPEPLGQGADNPLADNPVAENPEAFRVVTRRAPTPGEARALRRAWAIVRHIKSNAILLADGTGTVGIGCGQTSRIDSVVQAVEKARRGVGIGEGTVLASDAFFPFRDSIDAAHAAGITALIHPGGSLRDTETVAAADEQGMAMVLTGRRSFLH